MYISFILLCIIFSRYVTRRITAPFSTIKRMADDIASGNAVKYHGIENSGEFREIVALLNSMVYDRAFVFRTWKVYDRAFVFRKWTNISSVL